MFVFFNPVNKAYNDQHVCLLCSHLTSVTVKLPVLCDPALMILCLLELGYIRHTWHTFTPEL